MPSLQCYAGRGKRYWRVVSVHIILVFRLSAPAFSPGVAYTAADGGPSVGTLDLSTGIITPIVTGLSNPGGMMFVSTVKSHGSHEHDGVAKPAAIAIRDGPLEL